MDCEQNIGFMVKEKVSVETKMEFEEMLEKAKQLAGVKKEKSYFGPHLGDLACPERARDLLLDYAMVPMSVRLEKGESPWTDNFGESDEIDLPLIIINGEPAADTYWKRERTIEFVLKNLKLSPREKSRLEENLDTLKAYRVLYKQNVGD